MLRRAVVVIIGAWLGWRLSVLSPSATPHVEVSSRAPCRIELVTVPCSPPPIGTLPTGVAPSSSAPDRERAAQLRDEIEDCAGPDSTVWLDCDEVPCIVAVAAPAGEGAVDCLFLPEQGGRILHHSQADPEGRFWDVGSRALMVSASPVDTIARQNRMTGDLDEHVATGALIVE